MPLPEQVGDNTWRVRYRRDYGSIGSITGFSSETAADDCIVTMQVDQRRGSWTDPLAGRTTVPEGGLLPVVHQLERAPGHAELAELGVAEDPGGGACALRPP